MNRDDISAIIGRAEDFRVVLEGGEMWLDCPLDGCGPSVHPIPPGNTILELQEKAEGHLISAHLPPLPPRHHRCHGCYIPIPTGPGFGRWCGECAQ